MESTIEDNLGFMELLILNNIHNIPIVIFINGTSKYYIHKNITTIKNDSSNKYFNSSNINIGLDYNIDNKYPNLIEAIYIK